MKIDPSLHLFRINYCYPSDRSPACLDVGLSVCTYICGREDLLDAWGCSYIHGQSYISLRCSSIAAAAMCCSLPSGEVQPILRAARTRSIRLLAEQKTPLRRRRRRLSL